MNNCHGECDCGSPIGPHDPDCRSLDKCDGERGTWCEKHWQEKLYENGWLKRVSKYAVMPTDEDFDQELRDAGRGHLVRS